MDARLLFCIPTKNFEYLSPPPPPTHDPNSSLSTLAGLLGGIRTEGSDLDFHGLDCGVKDDILMTGSQLHCVFRYFFFSLLTCSAGLSFISFYI